MATELIGGIELEVDDEGFMTDPSQWSEELAPALGKEIGIDELTDEHWKVIRFLRSDFEAQGETATLREDVEGPTMTSEIALENAPIKGSGYFKVPRVIDR